MKKLFFAFVAVVALGITSCNKCGTCTTNVPGVAPISIEYCQKDGKDAYEAAKVSCELTPYSTWSDK